MASTEDKSTNGKPKAKTKPDKKPKCGIVMPISDMDGYPSGHWNDVLTILETVVKDADFEVDLVSNADEVTVIHQTIVQNLYENEVVICDVSGKNANVMFELGMRLAFDKPTIIIIDDRTDFSFDTGVISHVLYPSDLRFPKMVKFQKTLKEKILATHQKAVEDKNYSPFLKNFGRYKVIGLNTEELSADKFILEKLAELTTEVHNLRSENRRKVGHANLNLRDEEFALLPHNIQLSVTDPDDQIRAFHRRVSRSFGPKIVKLDRSPGLTGNEWIITLTLDSFIDAQALKEIGEIANHSQIVLGKVVYY